MTKTTRTFILNYNYYYVYISFFVYRTNYGAITSRACSIKLYNGRFHNAKKLKHFFAQFFSARWQHDFNQLFPSVSCHAFGQTSEQGRGHPDTLVDFHQILSSFAMGRDPHRSYLLHLWRRGNAGKKPRFSIRI